MDSHGDDTHRHSGWRYEPWRGVFYPKTLPQRRELEFASRAFPTIEINGSFYSLQRPASYQMWYEHTPPGFVFSIKGGRYITHLLRLKNCDKAMANFFASGIFNCARRRDPPLAVPAASGTTKSAPRLFRMLQRVEKRARARAQTRCALPGARLGIDCKPAARHAVEIATRASSTRVVAHFTAPRRAVVAERGENGRSTRRHRRLMYTRCTAARSCT